MSSFVNHMVDVEMMEACGEELAERLEDQQPTKVGDPYYLSTYIHINIKISRRGAGREARGAAAHKGIDIDIYIYIYLYIYIYKYIER